jgi:endogenous inhibitor of DNA gyrase (YacG/DUF329 family)
MDVSVSLPIDRDGFLRRQCPNCNRQFKWHHGPANAEAEKEPSPASYSCPLCGRPAEHDQWFTDAQVTYIQGVALPAAADEVERVLAAAFRGSKYIKFEPGRGRDVPAIPDQLHEPDDMAIVASPCHNYEPVKVPEDAQPPLYCLICGAAFAV